ncbi:MAG TPA: DNA repair protein RadA, partial [Anaeromyxobacteraceae bacterium]
MPRAAARARTVFACAECGHSSPKWLGQCPACRKWNTLHEEVVTEPAGPARRGFAAAGGASRPVPLREVEA